MKQNNPFVLSGYEGPEYFCDRVAETRSLVRAIENGNASCPYSLRAHDALYVPLSRNGW